MKNEDFDKMVISEFRRLTQRSHGNTLKELPGEYEYKINIFATLLLLSPFIIAFWILVYKLLFG